MFIKSGCHSLHEEQRLQPSSAPEIHDFTECDCKMASTCRSVFLFVQFKNHEKELEGVKIVINQDFMLVSESQYVNCDCLTVVGGHCKFEKSAQTEFRICRCAEKFLARAGDLLDRVRCLEIRLTPILFLYVLRELKTYPAFRRGICDTVFGCCDGSVCKTFYNHRHRLLKVSILWETDQLYIMDKAWVYRIERLIGERIELDDMMAWLSTLGGAFSSLGDSFSDCAISAGKISVRQWTIAARLGDPITLAKCKLYMAISLMQLGEIQRPKVLIRQIFRFAVEISKTTQEFRLEKMCKGAWAKLQFLYKDRKNYKRRNYSLALPNSFYS